MLASARRRDWRMAGASALSPAPGRNVGRAISPAAWGLRHRRVPGTMQASSPTKHRARSCRALQDTSAANRQCTPPSAPCGASTSPCRGGFVNGFHPKGSPVRGAVGVSRLRGAAHDLASILLGWHQARRRVWRMAGVCGLAPVYGRNVGRAISPAAGPCATARFPGRCEHRPPCAQGPMISSAREVCVTARHTGRCKHRPLRSAGQGPARFYRIFPPQSGNAPLRLRLAAHPPPLAGEAL